MESPIESEDRYRWRIVRTDGSVSHWGFFRNVEEAEQSLIFNNNAPSPKSGDDYILEVRWNEYYEWEDCYKKS